MSRTADTLVENLSHLMELYGYDQSEVAKRSGLTKRAINYYLNKERVPSVEKAEMIASAFGLSGWHLLMPNLPKDIQESKNLRRMVEQYLGSSRQGREMINMIVERESNYSQKGQ